MCHKPVFERLIIIFEIARLYFFLSFTPVKVSLLRVCQSTPRNVAYFMLSLLWMDIIS